jgi:hypothetical protein
MDDVAPMEGRKRPEGAPTERKRAHIFLDLGLLSLLVSPVAFFYYLLFHTQLALPILDDYDAVLAFANAFTHDHGMRSRLIEIVAWQHNEYKLIFEHTVVALMCAITGRVNFINLVLLGNAFVLLIGFVLWLYFRTDQAVPRKRLLVFVPVVFLLFNLQYAETVNWAAGSLQNLPVLAFSLLALWLAARPGRRAFLLSCLCLMLAIASSGNGFFVPLAALPMLVRRRAWGRLNAWGALTLGMIALYLFHYHLTPQQTLTGGVGRLLFPVMFLGGALGDVRVAFPLGACLWGIFLYALWHGYERQQPDCFAAMLFLAITALGVAVTRGESGISAEMASRYRIYSCLFLIFAYQYLMGRLSQSPRWRGRKAAVTMVAIALSAIFAARSDLAGYRFLAHRRADTIQQFDSVQQGRPVPLAEPRMQPFFRHAAMVLRHSVDAGIYYPPQSLQLR